MNAGQEDGITQATLDELVDALEAIRASSAKTEAALRRLIAALGTVKGDDEI